MSNVFSVPLFFIVSNIAEHLNRPNDMRSSTAHKLPLQRQITLILSRDWLFFYFFSKTFRETLEAAIIISVLLSLVENLFDKTTIESVSSSSSSDETKITVEGEETPDQRRKRLIRRMKIQVSWATSS